MTTSTESPIFADGFDSYVVTGDTIEAHHDGFHLVATVHRDDTSEAPWNMHDGHGPVSDWTRRAKRPGELVLNEDRGSKRFYDFAEACRIALRDGWGCAPYDVPGETKRQKAARAAMADFNALRGWCSDEWYWCGIVVTVSKGDVELGRASLWGIECNYPVAAGEASNAYLRECAEELAGEAIADAEATIETLCQCEES